MSPDAMFSFNNGLILLICGSFSLIVPFGWAQQRNNKPDEFSCPEEFGYYPHPTDCTQYYVCVFGGALVESCTGGLMYSHDLQTCDWPRNVGCVSSGSVTASLNNANGVNTAPGNEEIGLRQTTPSWKHEPLQTQQDEIPDRHLYDEEDLGPVEEIESDRQQRVYRGQPPALGQVARDRDGIIRHVNALQTSAGPEKVKPVAVLSYSPHHQSLRPPSSVSSYLIEQTSSSIPTTTKAIYNVTKYEPYYSVYDEDPQVYSDIEYGQYQNQRKLPNTYQVVQKSQHRLQPQQPQVINNVPSYTSSDYRLQSNIDADTQQTEKLPSTRGRNRGSITYTTGGNEYDSVTSAGGRARPTLKPSTSIVSKVIEAVDIYKNPPRRPDPVYPTPQVDKPAAKCRKDICLLPDCSCGGKEIPGDLPLEDVPQLVLLTFDDSVNELNKNLYADLFEKGRVNPNGCPISATFYVSHEWTDYSMVQNLYATGHEIASHSVSHSFGEQFSQRKWTKEIVGQREILSAYGGVRQEDIRGMRAPFLAVGGNKMFKMLYDTNFTYDSSMPIYENRPPSWPYTLDYKLFHDCMIPPCPTRSYPGVWEVPMVMWQDLNGGRCSMGDACSNPANADGVYKMLIKNFERHFTTNRAPFGLFYHSSWFTQPHHKEGFMTFLDTIMNMPEVWLVTNWQAIQWARDPTPISRLNQFTPFGCDFPERPKRCNNPKVCNLWHKSGVRYLKTCQPCPDVYPWTGKTGVRNSRVDNDDTLTE